MEDVNQQFANLFNAKGAEMTQNSRLNDEYRVSHKDPKATGGIYRSVVRFIPFWEDPQNSSMKKFVTFVKDPITGKGISVDDPRSVGQPSPVNEMYWKLKKSGNVQLENFANENLGTTLRFASLVQIVKDDQHPELVGQIKVFRYGKKIWDKLDAEEHPQIGQGQNPFHPTLGRYFAIVATRQGEWSNYDQSQFVGNAGTCPMWYKNAGSEQLENVSENVNPEALLTYLKNESPDLKTYGYKPWTAEQQQHVNNVLTYAANYLAGGTYSQAASNASAPQVNIPGFGAVSAPAPAAAPAPGLPNLGGIPMTPAPAAPSMGTVNLGGLDALGGTPVPPPAPAAAPVIGVDVPNVAAPTVHSSATPPPSAGFGNIDDIINSL